MNTVEVINAITEQIDKLNKQPIDDFSGDTLSRIGVRLASYKAGLGRHLASAKNDTLMAEKAFKEAKAKEYQRLRDSGKSATDANELKILGVDEEYVNYVQAQYLEEQISGLSYNVHDMIDSIKSRLINLQMESHESNVR